MKENTYVTQLCEGNRGGYDKKDLFKMAVSDSHIFSAGMTILSTPSSVAFHLKSSSSQFFFSKRK